MSRASDDQGDSPEIQTKSTDFMPETTSCISERRDANGYYWRYTHSPDEPHDTLTAAIMIAAEVAAEEARKYGRTYVVGSTPSPSAAVFVLARDHPELAAIEMSILFEFTADGECIKHKARRH